MHWTWTIKFQFRSWWGPHAIPNGCIGWRFGTTKRVVLTHSGSAEAAAHALNIEEVLRGYWETSLLTSKYCRPCFSDIVSLSLLFFRFVFFHRIRCACYRNFLFCRKSKEEDKQKKKPGREKTARNPSYSTRTIHGPSPQRWLILRAMVQLLSQRECVNCDLIVIKNKL